MTTVNREALRAFLAKYAKNPDRIPGAMELLEPLCTHAEAGQYALAPASELDPEAVRTAIALAIGKPVIRVIFVSQAHPFPRPDWMTEDAYHGSLGVHLGERFGMILRLRLMGSLGVHLGEILVGSLWKSLMENLGKSLMENLGVNPKASIGVSLGKSLLYFLCFTIFNDTEQVAQLTPIIQLLPRAIPIGEKQGEPGIWLVLVA